MVGISDIVTRLKLRVLEAARFVLAWSRMHLGLIALFAPIVLIAVGLAGYGLWWRAVAEGVRAKVGEFQAAQRALGRDIAWDSFVVEGFPYRVDGALNSLHFTAPDRGSAWDADRVVVHVQPLSLGHVNVSFEGQQHYFYARDRWIEANVRADTALVTLATRANKDERVDVDIAQMTGSIKLDDTDFNVIVASATGGIDIAPTDERGAPQRVDVATRLENVALQGKFDLPLGSAIQLIDIDMGATVPLHLPEMSLPALLGEWQRTGAPVDVRKFQVEWGGVSVAASGQFKIDANSLPDGRFTVTLGNHPRILELLEAHGWINASTHATAKKVLDVLAFMSGDAQRRVTVPLRIENGSVYVGPAKVATLLPAPTASMQLMPADSAAP